MTTVFTHQISCWSLLALNTPGILQLQRLDKAKSSLTVALAFVHREVSLVLNTSVVQQVFYGKDKIHANVSVAWRATVLLNTK